jgi:hypothetical protein
LGRRGRVRGGEARTAIARGPYCTIRSAYDTTIELRTRHSGGLIVVVQYIHIRGIAVVVESPLHSQFMMMKKGGQGRAGQ